MKKYIWQLSVLTLLAGITSCTPSTPISKENAEQSAPAPKPTKTITPEIQSRIIRGKQLFEKLKLKIPSDKNPSGWGQLSKNPTLALYVTNKIWKELSKSHQTDLTWFVENEITAAKTQPERYIDIPQTAPLYPRFVEITRNLCESCWSIILGDPVRKDGKLTMTIDKTIVQGDIPWENDDSFNHCCRGVKASQFRQ